MKSNLNPVDVFPIYGNLILPSFDEAKRVYFELMELYGKNKRLTVKDVYNTLGIKLFQQYRNNIFGWSDVREIGVMRLPHEKGCIYIPKRECLE